MRLAGYVAQMESTVYRILVGKPRGQRQVGRLRCRGVDNIKVVLREISWDDMDWIDLIRDRNQRRTLVNMVTNLRVSYNAGKFLSSCTIDGFSRRAQVIELVSEPSLFFNAHISLPYQKISSDICYF
jgi:hypothetical protein